jgi:hypothetical protein
MQSAPSNLWEWFTTLPGEGQFFLLVGGGMFLLFTIIIIASTVSEMHKHRLVNELKRDLLERGLSAEEIATVVSVKPRKFWSFGCGKK